MANSKRYSLKDRYNYHSRIANTGKRPDGTKVSTVSRVTHALRADEIRKQQNTFMQGVEFGRNLNKRNNRKKN